MHMSHFRYNGYPKVILSCHFHLSVSKTAIVAHHFEYNETMNEDNYVQDFIS
jgi:hypothetical protein